MGSAFEKAVSRFCESLTKSQKEQFAHCKQQDVEKTIQDIQDRHGSQKRLKNMRRVSKFIEGMSQLGQVIEVFLNLDNTVAFVWGPIKFLLLAANTWVETLDLLLETYAEIGEALPGLSQYPKLFCGYPFVQKHLENYYCDVLEFNRCALEVFARPGWKAVFHSTWRTFKSQFGPILSSFKRHQQLLTDEKLTALMSEVQTLRHHAEEKFQFLENEITARHSRDSQKEIAEIEETRHRQRRIVQGKLDAPDFHKDHEHASQMRQTSYSSDWIFVDSKFREWTELGTFSSKWFYLNGIPGAGKTILVSRIIDHLKELQEKSKALGRNFSVIYFYFKHLHDNKRQMMHLLLGLVSQLADQENSLLDFFYQQFSSIDQQNLTLHKLCDLASTALRAQRRCFIVIDGLDECAQGSFDNKTSEVERIFRWFEELILPQKEVLPDSNNVCIRLLFSGQRDGYLEEKLRSYPSIRLETAAGHGEDIKSYAKAEAAKICKKFSAEREIENDIIQKVTTRAKGMFLFAKIVLDNLYDQISVFDFESELKTENFPSGLDKAYERLVKRVLENPIKPERLAAEQILGLVISAERPLRWREIQSRFCIDPVAGIANIRRQSVKSCKYLCGSLVEVGMMGGIGDPGSEGEVEMVHSTAKAYLIQTKALSLSSEHARMALFCTQYLTSHPLQLSIEKDIQAFALTGYYGFHDYATAFWWNHVDKLIEAREELSFDTYSQTLQSVAKLFRAHLNLTDMCEEESKDLDAIARQFGELPRSPRQREKVMNREFAIGMVRNAIEAIRDGGDKTAIVDETNDLPLYGPIRYKCSKPWCHLFATGFEKSKQRKDHVNEHERPFRCSIEGCYVVDIGFSTESGLTQHIRRHHTQPEIALFPKSRQRSKRTGDICAAAENGDLNSVRDLVGSGSNVNVLKVTAKGPKTPLMLAVEHGHLDVCEYLLGNGANVNFHTASNRESILHAAVRRDDIEIIDLLLKQDIINIDGTEQALTPPNLAAAMGYNLSLYLFKTRKPQAFDMQSCLVQAIQHNQIHTAQMLLIGDPTSINLSQSFITTLSKASDDMIRLLLASNTLGNSNQIGPWHTLLHESCRLGNVRFTRRLIPFLDNLDRPDHTGQTPLEIAAEMGSIEIVSMLLASDRVELGKDINPILAKYVKYDSGIIEMFLKVNPSLAIQSDQNGATLLHHAVYTGNVELVQRLIQMDVDVNAVLRRHPSCYAVSYNIKPASKTPLEIAMELVLHAFDDGYVSNPRLTEWKAGAFVSIAQTLLASDKVDLSNLDCREELQCLALAARLGTKSLTWSLIDRGLLYFRGRPLCREDDVAQLMAVLDKDFMLLMAATTDRELLGDVLTTLVSNTVPQETGRQSGLLVLIGSSIDLLKKVFTCGSLMASRFRLEETRLAMEEVVRQKDVELVQKMILGGFDHSKTALLLAAASGTIEMVEAMLETDLVSCNITNDAGRLPHEVAWDNRNFEVYERLKFEHNLLEERARTRAS